MIQEERDVKALLRNLSTQDFLAFGLHQVAYIRPVIVHDKPAYMVHAADGTLLSVFDSRDTALTLARHNDLEPVTLH